MRGLPSAAVLAWAAFAEADDGACMLAQERMLRPMVLPALVGVVDVSTDATTRSPAAPLVVTSAGARTGLSPLPGWTGLEAAVVPASFIVSHPDVGAYVPRASIEQRLFPFETSRVAGESHGGFELAFRARAGRDPMTLDLLADAALPFVVRARGALRVDVTPSIGFYPALARATASTAVLATFYPARTFWLGPSAAVGVPDTSHVAITQIAAGAQVGVTIPAPIGPIADVVLDARFPHLLLPAQVPDYSTRWFETVLLLRVYAYGGP
jgi:hypothetical protein